MKYQDYEALHFDFYRTMFLQLTLTCPLRCGHCNVNAGPERRESLSLEAVERGIRSFAALPTAELVCLTGGEPFLPRSALKLALAVCEEVGLRTYVITAAHWAPTEEAALKVLRSLPPITLLSVSADRFHETFVPLSYVRNAIVATIVHGTSVILALTLDNDNDPYRAKVADVFADLWDRLDVCITYLQPVGRAVETGVGRYPANDDPVPMEPCPMLGTPAITADGSICACCQAQETNLIGKGAMHALRLGRLGETDFTLVRDTVKTDPLLRSIRHLGPGWVFKRALDRGIDVGERRSFQTICDVCSVLVRDVDLADRLRAMLREPALKIQVNLAAEAMS